MIDLYVQKVEDLWCGAALESDKIFTTTFAFSEKNAFESLLKELPYNMDFQAAQKRNALADEIVRAIKAVYDGRDFSFSFRFAMEHLSEYYQRVLKLTSLIPTGYVTIYSALAKAAGGSPRSVGRVMATNPFAPLVPCHRVVTTNMTLGGYGGGLKTKWNILQKENRNYSEVIEAEIDGKPLKLIPISMLKPYK